MQPEKSVLFLISLSQDKIQEIINKGVDYGLFLKSIRGNSHVEVQETINEKLLSSASHYRVVVIVGHQIDGCIEMADGSLFPMAQIVSSLPSTFSGYLHVAVCGSSIIFNATKEHCPDSRVRTSQKTTQLELQLLIYSLLLNRTDLSKETFDYWYEFERNYIKEIQERKNPADLAKLPCATKLGAEPSESIKTSVFAPEKVTRGEFYQLQIFMHLDEATGTLYFDDAKGNDPNAARKKVNVALKNIHKGDIISLYLSFLDAEHLCPTNLIIVHELDCEEDYYTMVIPINEEKQEVVLHVKVTREYPYSRFFTELKFIKDNECLTNPFNWETEVKTDDSQNNSKIERVRDIGDIQNKLVRAPERIHLPIEQIKQWNTKRRKEIVDQLLKWVDRGDWKHYEIADKVKQMILTVLGESEIQLNDEEAKMAEDLWSLLENGRGDRVKIVWQNLVGYFDEQNLFRKKGSPALNKDFFDNKDGYSNIDKGRPSRNDKGHPVFGENTPMSKGFYGVLDLLDKYYQKIFLT